MVYERRVMSINTVGLSFIYGKGLRKVGSWGWLVL